MPKIASMSFKGKSRTEYDFDVYPIDTSWKENVKAVYVVTRRYQGNDNKYYHEKIYIGRSDNLKERFGNHHQQACFDKNDANCICIHLESNESKRETKETDLIQGNNTLCNKT